MSVEPQDTTHSEQASTHTTTRVTCDLDDVPIDEVRHRVRQLLDGRTDVTAQDAVLVTDELTTNALRHGTAPRSCRLAVLDQGRRLRIEVDDTSPQMPKIRTPDHHGGRGLILVDRLTASWGVHRYPHHKTVWAELALDQRATDITTAHITLAHDGRT